MMNAVQVFVLVGNEDWRLASADLWELDVVELDGTEKVIGHRKIDGSIYKIIKVSDEKIVAITK